MFEVTAAGKSLGITKYFKDAEFWFNKVSDFSTAKLLQLDARGRKRVIRERKGRGFTLRSISKL